MVEKLNGERKQGSTWQSIDGKNITYEWECCDLAQREHPLVHSNRVETVVAVGAVLICSHVPEYTEQSEEMRV